MNKLKSLIYVDLRTNTAMSIFKNKKASKQNMFMLVIILLAMLSLLPALVMIMIALSELYKAFNSLGQASYFILVGFLASQFLVLLFGSIFLISKYFFSKDLAMLIPLPIKKWEILTSKFISTAIIELLLTIPVLLPFLIIYNRNNPSIMNWIFSIIILVAAPIVPIAIASFLVMLFMKVTNIRGNKDLFRIISSVIMLVVILFLQLKLNKLLNNSLMSDPNFFNEIITNSEYLINTIGLVWPIAILATKALMYSNSLSGILYLLGFLVATAAIAFISLYVSQKYLFKSILNSIGHTSGKSKKKIENLKKSTKFSKPYLAICKKELIMIVKTPVYAMNSIGGMIILPALMIGSSLMGDNTFNILGNISKTNQFATTMIGIALVALFSTMNSVAATTFSRENESLWIHRVAPVFPKDQILGRLLATTCIQSIGVILLMVVLMIQLKASPTQTITIIAVGLIASLPLSLLSMLIDITRPLIGWTNPQQAMKQNLNVLFSMLLSMLLGVLVGFGVFLLKDQLALSIILILVSLLAMLLSVLFYTLLLKQIKTQFKSLE